MNTSPESSMATSLDVNVRKPAARPLTYDSVKHAYGRMAPVYDCLFQACFGPGQRRAIERLNQAPGTEALEVGVGTGLTLPLWSRDTRVTGIDLSPEMLARAERVRDRHDLRHVVLRVEDAQATRFEDDSFSKIAALYVVSVVPNLPALLKEIHRIAKPGARVVIVNHFAHPNRVVRRIESWLAAFEGVLGFNPSLPVELIMKAEGFRVIETAPVNWFGYWTLIEAEVVK